MAKISRVIPSISIEEVRLLSVEAFDALLRAGELVELQMYQKLLHAVAAPQAKEGYFDKVMLDVATRKKAALFGTSVENETDADDFAFGHYGNAVEPGSDDLLVHTI